jgi:hypothetical protein
MTTPFAMHIYIAKSLYQRIYYALPEVALQGSITTLRYALVIPTNNHCKVATDIDRL